MRGNVAAEAQGVGLFTHGGDAEGDVLFQRDAEFFGAFTNVVAANAFSERFILESAFNRIHLQVEDAFRWADVGAGSEKSCEFVASEESVLEGRLAREIAIVGVG